MEKMQITLSQEQTLEDSPEYAVWVNNTRLKIVEGLEQSKRGECLAAEIVISQLRDKVKLAQEARV